MFEGMTREEQKAMLDLMEKTSQMPYIPARFYVMIEGNYKQDDDDQWWFQKRHPDLPLIGKALMRAFTTFDPADQEAAKEEMNQRFALQDTVPWVKCGGDPGHRTVEETKEWLETAVPAVKEMNEMTAQIEQEYEQQRQT